MRIIALITTLVAVAPVWAQSSNPLEGPQPNTVMLDGNWQMTPSDTDCMLVHRDPHNRPDLLIASRHDDDHAVFGLLLATGAPYAAALQLSVIAQTSISREIGKVTFTPHQDTAATLLMARWPTINLLSRLQTANRLSFYDPRHRLVTSVPTVGGESAAASFRQCLSRQTGR